MTSIDNVLKLFKKANNPELVNFIKDYEDFYLPTEVFVQALKESLNTFPVEDEESAKILELLQKQAKLIEDSFSSVSEQLKEISEEILNISGSY